VNKTSAPQWRAACTRPTNQYDMQINNVRSRMHVGGHVWSDAAYIVPKPAPGELAVSALFAGGVWIGGKDRAGNTKLSAATYRSLGFDFFSGPLDLQTGATESQICKDWDRFFIVNGNNILDMIKEYDLDPDNFDCDVVSEDVRYWPAQGNPYFNEKFTFTLLDQPLANYWDQDGDGDYDPCNGDFPVIDLSEVVNRKAERKQKNWFLMKWFSGFIMIMVVLIHYQVLRLFKWRFRYRLLLMRPMMPSMT
jgi:hypothetical protein